MTPHLKTFVCVLFFLSGMTGLIYEVLWAKFLVLFIGNTTYAHSVVIATFMGGLAIGYYFLGRLVDRMPERALLLYALFEVGIGLYAFAYPSFFAFVSRDVFVEVAAPLAGSAWVTVLKFGLALSTMIVPTVLMGGTLPALTKTFVVRIQETKREVARLYFLNSLGGVCGCLVAGYYLIPGLGLPRPVLVAGALNVLLGAAVLPLAARRAGEIAHRAEAAAGATAPIAPTDFAGNVAWLLLAAALSGGVVMTYEVAWIRLLSMVLGSGTYSFSVMLAAFISGIALGAYVVERIAPRVRRPFLLFGLLQIGIALSVLLTLPLYERLPHAFLRLRLLLEPSEATFATFQGLQFGLCLLLMLAPTTLSGMSLPLVSQLASRRLESLGRSVGAVFAWNTLGTVAGAMLAGLALLPSIGVQRTLELGSALSLGIGAVVVTVAGGLSPLARAVTVGAPVALFFLLSLSIPAWDPLVMQSGVFRWREDHVPAAFAAFAAQVREEAELVFYEDGVNASVAVERRDEQGREELVLKINGKPDASRFGDLKTELLLAHIPMLLHPDPQRVLVIGFGSGISLGAVLQYPVERVDLLEIEPAVIDAGRFFVADNHDALADPRVHLYLDDARTFLLLTDRQYDVVISEPSNPWIAGVGNLFTKEFYEIVERVLAADGVVCQWFHSYEMSDFLVRVILRTFLSSFPAATLWNGGPDYYLVGSREALRLDWARLERRMARPGVRADLARIRIADVPSLLSTQTLSTQGVTAAAGTGVLNRDSHPVLEYAAPRAFYAGGDATVLEARDERRRPRTSIWLHRYLVGRRLRRENYRHMYQHHAAEDPDETLMHWILEAWLRDFPADVTANWKALARWEMEDPERALRHVDALLAADPGDPRLAAWKGLLLGRLERSRRSFLHVPDLEDAIGWMRQAVENASRHRDLYSVYLGRLHEVDGDLTRAIAAYEAALAHVESRPPEAASIEPTLVYRLLAASHARRRDLPAAQRYLRLVGGSPDQKLPRLPLAGDP